MAKVGLVFHPQYLKHETGPGHPERVERLQAILKMLEGSGLREKLVDTNARKATLEDIALVHDPDYIQSIVQTQDRSGTYLDGDTFASPGTFEASLYAAGGLIEAVDQVWERQLDHAFAMVRPPGHHAERDHAMGFCIFNNVGVAAQYLIKEKGLKRVAVVDFDVHHGNATQHMFYDRGDVFYLSTHRYPFYPGTGAAGEKGKGAGAGYTLNIPLGAGCGDKEYIEAFENKLLPALKEYQPEFLLISAGFDAHQRDPLGGMNLTKEGFVYMTEALERVAQDSCKGKAVYTLEGGYDLKGLSESVEGVLEVLLKQ